MEDLLKLKDAQIEALQNELQKHKDFILKSKEDFENFRNELKDDEE